MPETTAASSTKNAIANHAANRFAARATNPVGAARAARAVGVLPFARVFRPICLVRATAGALALAAFFAAGAAESFAQMAMPSLGFPRQPGVARVPTAEERQREEIQRYREMWKMDNEDWGRANVDGRVLTVFDVRRRVSLIIDSVRNSAMIETRNEMSAAAKVNPANWDVWRVPVTEQNRNTFPFALRARRAEAAPAAVQQQFLRHFEAERARRTAAAAPGTPAAQIAGESLVAARETVAQELGARPDQWEIALADGGGTHVLRTVEWELLPPNIQDEFRRRTENNFNTRARLSVERNTLKEITDNILLAKEGRERGVNITSSMLAGRIEEAIKREPDSDRAAFYSRLEAAGGSLRQERTDMEEEMVVGYMRAEIVRPVGVEKDIARARVSPRRIHERYEKIKGTRYTEPAHYRYRQLWLTPTGAGENAATVQGQAQFVQDEIKRGGSFAELVKHSMNKDPGRDADGGAGLWYEAGKLNEKVRAILEALPDGGVSAPLDFSVPGGRANIYFVQRVECRPGAVSRLEDVQDEIADEIAAEERQSLTAEFLERLGGPDGKYFNHYYDNRD